MTNDAYQIILTTCSSAEQAQRIASSLVEDALAACVNIVAGMQSVYQWQGSLHSDAEHLLLIKSRVERFDEIAQRIKTLHNYELPEIIAVSIVAGSQDYLAWLSDATKQS